MGSTSGNGKIDKFEQAVLTILELPIRVRDIKNYQEGSGVTK
jgi:hypothetical protein